jgi:3-isopropylmalate dehydrogenase
LALTVPVLLGDDIGPDVVGATTLVLGEAARRCGVELRFQELPAGIAAHATHGSTLPDATLRELERHPGWILGPVGNALYPKDDVAYRNPSGHLRTAYELYANVRPARSLPGVRTRWDGVDLVVVRENTEGFYADRNLREGNGELRPSDDMVLSVRVVTRTASLRVARQAFELARRRAGRRKVTIVHKANVLRKGDGLFVACCREVARDYPEIEVDDLHVDAAAMHLAMRPDAFDVIVTTNMFGDILSDEAAGLVGGLGLAPGLNVGDSHAMAQAVHGSAPDIAATRSADPIAEILSGSMLLGWLAERVEEPRLAGAAAAVDAAVARALEDGRTRTPDLGGTATTATMAEAIAGAL